MPSTARLIRDKRALTISHARLLAAIREARRTYAEALFRAGRLPEPCVGWPEVAAGMDAILDAVVDVDLEERGADQPVGEGGGG
jgi:hypothetical protein